MTDYRELSRLPDDPAYWDDLESRVLSSLGPVTAVPVRTATLSPLSARATSLAVLAAAAAIATILLVPPRSSRSPQVAAGLLELPADDPAMIEFVSSPSPPDVGTLLLTASRMGR